MVMAISGISTGCSNKTEKPNKKQEASTTEKKKVETKDTEEKESKSSSEETKKETKYEYGITNLDSVEYVKDPSVPEVGEDGNSMNVPMDILGYIYRKQACRRS